MALQNFWVEVKDETGEIGNRWKDGQVMVVFTPGDPPTKGKWYSHRSSDVDSGGGTDHAIYIWDVKKQLLLVQTGGYQGDTVTKTHLTLTNFHEIKCNIQGSGSFNFRGKARKVSWKMNSFTYDKDGWARCEEKKY